jgi:hypothetical protein
MTTGFNVNEDPDMTGKTVPPYEGRRDSADVDEQEESTKDGAKVGGATGPVADDEMKAPEPEETERGRVASPADEQPAEESPTTDTRIDMTGPGHETGVTRGEDVR